MRGIILGDEPTTRILPPVPDETTLAELPYKLRRDGSICELTTLPGATYIWRRASISPPLAGYVVVPNDIAASAAYIANPVNAPGRWENQSVLDNGEIPHIFARLAVDSNQAATRVGNVLTANAPGALTTFDSRTPAVNDRIFFFAQTSGQDNGVYVLTSLGSVSTPWSAMRVGEMNQSAEVTSGLHVYVADGAVYGTKTFTLTTLAPITLNTTALVFSQSSSAGNATTGAAGGVQLAGDLGGQGTTAAAPKVGSVNGQVLALHTVRNLLLTNVASLAAYTVASSGVNDNVSGGNVAGDRVLLVGQCTPAQNGIYVVGAVTTGVAALTRASDWAAGTSQPSGTEVLVSESGSVFANTKWFASKTGGVAVGTDAPAFYPRKYVRVTTAMSGSPGIKALTAEWILSATGSSANPVAKVPGTQGFLSIGALSTEAGTGSFTVTSTANETSTLQVTIEN